MQELIRRGYLYIAQPPLYKIAKGKKVRYLKSDAELSEFVLDVGLEGLTLESSSGALSLTGEPLRRLMVDLKHWRERLAVGGRRQDPVVIEALIRATNLDGDGLRDREVVEQAAQAIEAYVQRKHPDRMPLTTEISRDEERDRYSLTVTPRAGVSSQTNRIDFELLNSGDIKELRAIQSGISALGRPLTS